MNRVASLVAVVAALASMHACTGPPAAVRHPSPAPDFSYITDEQLESAMWQLAAGIKSLDAIFGNREPVTQSQRLEVIRILDQMLVAVDELGPNAVSANHPHIASNLGRFREKLVIAHNSVEMEPPRYYLVGQFSGACRACHTGE